MKATTKKSITIITIIVIIFLIASWLVKEYNKIPVLDEEVNAKWSQVLNTYKRRADLIPNLVETVKSYAIHEKETLQNVIEARSKATQMNITPETLENPEQFKKFEKAQGALSSALSRLMVVIERYPELKANQNFLGLQAELEGTENRIAVARRDYIETVKRYNTHVKQIPGKFIASMFFEDAGPKPLFEISEQEQQTPNVQFNF
jgi:LemA protein